PRVRHSARAPLQLRPVLPRARGRARRDWAWPAHDALRAGERDRAGNGGGHLSRLAPPAPARGPILPGGAPDRPRAPRARAAGWRGVPVLVDVASMVPPRENLFRYLRDGADLVIVSGGKGIRGPQSTGILAGRRDLIRAATLNASPNQAIGRAAKTSKEEIVGLVTALELFLAEDEKAEMERYHEVCASIVGELGEVPGIRAVVEQDPVNRVLPPAVLYFEPSWTGPSGRAVQLALAAGDPHIYVQQGPHQGGYFDEIAIDPINLEPGDEAIIVRRLLEELTRR